LRVIIVQEKTQRWNKRRLFSAAFQFLLLFAFWLILSGHFQFKYILIGAAAAGLVTCLTNDLFYSALRQGTSLREEIISLLVQLWRWFIYLFWLLSRIVMANVQVALIILNPKLPIDPAILVFKSTMKKGLSRVTLANSITLTPGTVTVDIEYSTYYTHTLYPPLAGELVDATMQNQIANVFLEEKEEPPQVRWVRSLEELK
jgi:multicomponent Na+:H+ antiporter subunit E